MTAWCETLCPGSRRNQTRHDKYADEEEGEGDDEEEGTRDNFKPHVNRQYHQYHVTHLTTDGSYFSPHIPTDSYQDDNGIGRSVSHFS